MSNIITIKQHPLTRRLNHELDGIEYDITEVDNYHRPCRIICYYKGIPLDVKLGLDYPFQCPRSISDLNGSWEHKNYSLYQLLVSKYTKKTTCLHCDAINIDNWSPSSRLVQLFERFRRTDELIATCIKLEVIFFRNRQVVELPEDVIFYVLFPYFHFFHLFHL